MKNLIVHIAIVVFSVTISYGQISPGDLSEAHKELEGMSNCTQCHELGEKVLDRKCLECHKEIQTLINKKEGLHGQVKVIKQDCFKCHSDHHGRKFDMIHLDEDSFNHEETGYELEGKHATVDCRECHMPDNIQNIEIKKKKHTFLGLDQECLACHDDFHQETLSADCVQCHDFKEFRPASNFNHNDAEFALKGKHKDLECIECHKETTRNGKEFQEFAGLAFEDCVSCHEDPHERKLPGDCKSCHKEDDFSLFFGGDTFNHNTTNFTLNGKHNEVDCFSCHKESDNPLLVFQDNLRTNENNCVKCHDDVHEGKFGLDCAKCHRETSFLSIKEIKNFDHSVTDYPLEGKHLQVDCKKCHKGRFTMAIDFSACNKCHDDYHQGEFAVNNISPDCIECHSLQEGFDYSLYTLDQHQETDFPLKGAHVATPCYACHVSEEKDRWTFRELGSKCVDCHNDIHENYISVTFYPKQDCTACHINDTWSSINSFDHSKTDWALEGKHQQVACRDCHFTESENNKNEIIQKFTNLETDCIACHDNVHENTFAINGVTDCVRCHVTTSWIPENFDHDTTNFSLEGKHTEVDCRACHTSTTVNGKEEIIYKLNKLECIDCHQ
ncbi:hypothetical protein GCM10023314_19240 [Algibacter agarivorans]|uniref:Cytochrome C n=1 Tax=Algibacter agarivorans TaxID=1109741 RepID=A0ABP9GRX7_9FLAO